MLHLVLNRRARNLGGEAPIRRALLGAARDVGARVHETENLADLDRAARAIAEGATSERAPVVLAGGDGSYMAGLTALARAYGDAPLPPIALAPGGTVGTVARNWSRREHGWNAAAADRIVRRAARAEAAETTRRPTLHVTDDRGGDHLGFIFGAGLVAHFFDEYYAAPSQGYATAAQIVARVFAGSFVGGRLARRVLTPVEASLTVDGVTGARSGWSLVLASVIRDAGLHLLVTPHGGEKLGAFHAVASPLGPRALGPQLPLVVAGKRLLGAGHVDAPFASDVTLRFARAGTYVLDGDVLRASEARVRAGPPIDVLDV